MLSIFSCGRSFAATPGEASRGVLFLTFSDPDHPETGTLIQQTRSYIEENSHDSVRFEIEYIDADAFAADPAFPEKYQQVLRQKYYFQRFDLVVAIGERPFGFAKQMRSKLFPDATLLFVMWNPANPASWARRRRGRPGLSGD